MLFSLLVVMVVAGAGWWIAAGRWPAWTGGVVYFAAGVNLAACWLSFLPVSIVRRKRPSYVPQAALGATVIRLLAVASGTFAAIRYAWWPGWPVAVWVTAFYLSLLAVETVILVRLMHELWASKEQVTAA
jgi:hypothetical protein